MGRQPLKRLSSLLVLALLAMNGCGGIKPLAQLEPVWEEYLQELTEFRKAKDVFFQSADSPLAEGRRSTFSGLCYYPPAAAFRVAGTLHRYEKAEVRSPADGAGEAPMTAVGLFRFELAGTSQALEAWQAGDKAELTVLFTDQTNGVETYGAGRYAALEAGENDMYILDFNYAYNPYCHYSHDFICPLPPPANRLELRVEAGEKNLTEFHQVKVLTP